VKSAPAPTGYPFLSGYAGLLARADVRRLVIASMVARLPTATLPLAILLLLHERTGSLAASGLAVGAFGLGRAAVSPIAGALIDRMGQARILVTGAAAQAVLLVAFVAAVEVGVPVYAVAAMAVAAGAASPPVQACLRALWPVVTTGVPAREAAYSFDATSQEMIWIVGPLRVAALLTVGSAAAAVLVCAFIGCVGVALFASSPISYAWRGPKSVERARLGALAGRDLRVLVVTVACTGISWGALTFGLTALAVELANGKASGLLLACVGVGSIGGGLLYGGRRWGWSVPARYRALLVANVACGAPLLFAGSVLAAVPMSLLAGLPLAPVYASAYILTGRVAPAGTTTEAFAWTSSAFALGVSVGMSLAGVAGQVIDVHAAFGLASGASAAAWLIARFLCPAIA
jgi:MFS family permease